MTKRITVCYGDGIGPEIMDATIRILKEAQAKVDFDVVEVGEALYKKGYSSGISEDAWKTLYRNDVFLKAPITTPQGGGYKSLNVTIRKTLGLFANVRPCVSYFPYIDTAHPDLDVVVVRENEEDLYAGIEYQHTHNMFESVKLISKTGSQKIIRYAFEYAVANNRKKVTCLSKDNIMKFSDGIFHKVFDEMAREYPQIAANHMIIDIGAAKLAAKPEQFDVVVTSNLYGDIISDIVAETSGSVGLAGSANIGKTHALFEAIHGSAPDIAGKNIANPSGLLSGAIMMLVHIGQPEIASKIHNAWLKTLEEGCHTADIYNPALSREKLGTKEFADAVIARLGMAPKKFNKIDYGTAKERKADIYDFTIDKLTSKILVGIDISIDWQGKSIEELATQVKDSAKNSGLGLKIITALGLKIWPADKNSHIALPICDHWQLRFVPDNQHKTTTHNELVALQKTLVEAGFDIIKTENLYVFGDRLGFSLAQGE